MTGVVLEIDPRLKALTGRTPEIIEEETGLPPEELFPEDKDILYVGDPWQKMGLERDNRRMIIDCEFGEMASFVDDRTEFEEEIQPLAEKRIDDYK